MLILDKLSMGNKKDSSDFRNPHQRADLIAQSLTGVEGELRVCELLLASNPKERLHFLMSW